MTINVAERLGTKYVIQAYVLQFREILSGNESDVYDLAGLRLGFQAANALKEFYATRTIINSKDPELNKYLTENTKRARETKPVDKICLYPPSYDIMDIHEYIDSLREGVVYEFRVDYRIGTEWQLAFLCLLILSRPEIIVDTGRINSDLNEFVKTAWLSKAKHHDAYLEVDGPNLVERRVVDGYVKVPYRNELSEDMYREIYKCFPIEFGRDYLFENKEWDGLIDKCISILTRKVQQSKRIKDFIETR